MSYPARVERLVNSIRCYLVSNPGHPFLWSGSFLSVKDTFIAHTKPHQQGRESFSLLDVIIYILNLYFKKKKKEICLKDKDIWNQATLLPSPTKYQVLNYTQWFVCMYIYIYIYIYIHLFWVEVLMLKES